MILITGSVVHANENLIECASRMYAEMKYHNCSLFCRHQIGLVANGR